MPSQYLEGVSPRIELATVRRRRRRLLPSAERVSDVTSFD
jgi:hypothetical protein